MKRFSLCLWAVLLGALSASTQTADDKVLLTENFSLFTAGTQARPDANDIASADGFLIPAHYTAMPGWRGLEVHQAGGCCYVGYNDAKWDIGFISTPDLELAVNDMMLTVVCKVRARYYSSASEMRVALRDKKTGNDVDTRTFVFTKDWQTFTVSFPVTCSSGCIILGATDEFFVDDLTVSLSARNSGLDSASADGDKAVIETGLGMIGISLPSISRLVIRDLVGRVVADEVTSSFCMNLSPGIYFVITPHQTVKVAVR